MIENLKPKLLDLFSGAGGAARGYQMAGFHVTGIDIKSQPRYAGDVFIQADALEYVREHGHEYDAIHASPPCQGYSIMRNLPWLRGKEYPLLIDPTRDALNATGKPWVIENVMGAKLAAGWLCGTMFGLPFYRHRAFESTVLWLMPGHPRHEFSVRNGRMMGARARDVVFGSVRYGESIEGSKPAGGVAAVRDAFGIDWMTQEEIGQAIPPAYTEYIGSYLIRAVLARTEATA